MKTTSPGFIHDISNLDRLRAGVGEDSDQSLRAAAEQFEAIFTQMLFKSMRQANEAFESDLMSSSNTKFFEQMHDEQMASELSTTGSLGLADLIVEQLGSEEDKAENKTVADDAETELAIRRTFNEASALRLPVDAEGNKPDHATVEKAADDAFAIMMQRQQQQARQQQAEQQQVLAPAAPVAPLAAEAPFETPKDFVSRMQPYAEKAAHALGTDPSVLIAQAALETGWGKKVIKNAAGSSNNLFNIKADPRWAGNKVATNTLEFHNGIPVQERAAFRSYGSYQDSFNDYVRFLNDNPRYAEALEQPADPSQFIRNLHKAGYATDPNYADKIISVMGTVKGLME